MRCHRTLAAWLCLAILPHPASAGSARDYLNAPINSWLAFYNAGYFTSVTPEDGMDLTSTRTNTDVFAQSLVITRTFGLWGRTSGISAILPYNILNVSSGNFSASSHGVSDIGFLIQMNIFGGPAFTREDFHNFVPQNFASFHLAVTTPLGQYQPSSPLNASANRWMINPTINYSFTPDKGWTWLELYVAARFFTANNNYRVGGAARLQQNPLFITEAHASRNFTQALWLSADAYYSRGGETSIDGASQHNGANTLRLGLGLGYALWRGADLALNYEHVVAKPAGQPDAQAFLMTIRQFW